MSVVLSDEFALAGVELGLDQAESIKAQGVRLIDSQTGPFDVDLSGLQRANSVTVAVLVTWYRHATLQQKPIVFSNLSEKLRNIIEFSGLTPILISPRAALMTPSGASRPGDDTHRQSIES